jgi:hypothetical protein
VELRQLSSSGNCQLRLMQYEHEWQPWGWNWFWPLIFSGLFDR